MWVIFLEAALALALLLAMVWATMSRRRRHDDESSGD